MNTKKNKLIQVTAFGMLLLAFSFQLSAQNPAGRFEIDAKRKGVQPTDKDALPRGREFIRLDSTYYVGWLYTGMFKNDRAADYAGYRQSVPDMLKAFNLLEKDYSGVLVNLFSNPQFYIQNNQKFSDYMILASKLRDTYESLDVPDSCMWVLNRVAKKRFRRDFLGIPQMKAWTIHRNRFFTHNQYAWLGNSVEENEKMALQYCYQSIDHINQNKAANDLWYGPTHDLQDKQFVYHYLALLECYDKNYDSCQYYYDKLKAGGGIQWTNYGEYLGEVGEFRQSVENITKDKYRGGDQHFLREPFYYLPLLSIYSGNTKEAMATAQEAITASNSTPGFGWYNLALARGYLYDGQLDSADVTITKAQEFKELHIGTTLTQTQYDFTVGSLRLAWYNMKIAQVKFLDKGWWYTPKSIYQLAYLTVNKYMHEYLMATKLATNPERERLIYELFCSEGTTTWDESWFLLKDFSKGFFIQKMEDYTKTDTRKKIIPYFQLFHAMLKYNGGSQKEALGEYEEILSQTILDTTHEKLFLARMYEGLANGYNYTNDHTKCDFYTNLLYEHFPQLVPYSGLPVKVKLTTTGDEDDVTKKVIKELKGCNINFVDAADENTITAIVSFKKKGIKYMVTVSALSGTNLRKVDNNIFYITKPELAGQEIAKRMFGSSGAQELEVPVVYNNAKE